MNGEKYIRFDKRRGTYSVRISGYGNGNEVFHSRADSFEDAIRIRNEFLISTYGNLDYLKKARYPERIKENRYEISGDGTYYTFYTCDEKHAFKVSTEDFEKVSKYTWYYSSRYITSKNMGMLHRYLLDAPKEMEVDHINLDKMDNRRGNLRIATHAENCRNRGKRRDKRRSNYKGVYFINGKYNAEIKDSNGKVHRMCGFETEEEAAQKYNEMAVIYHGEFANLNKIHN